MEIDTGYRRIAFKTLYKIEGLLGVGAFGVVLAAETSQSREKVALKVIS
jgi:serine/threonine protein kinase